MKFKTIIPIAALLLFGLFAGCDKDDDNDDDNFNRPSVSATDPANNATDVFLNKIVTATFSESMDPTSLSAITFTLYQGETQIVGTVSYEGTIASFTPTSNLLANTIYSGKITTGAKNLEGIALKNDYNWTFTTGTVVGPYVISTEPVNNATNVTLNKVVKVVFNESMNPATINGTTFTVKHGQTPVEGIITYVGKTAMFTPSNMWIAETEYTATITTGVENLAGTALNAGTIWSFTTGAATVIGLETVNLGTSGNYVILAKTAITNISISDITGDLGLSPAATSYITGLSLTDATGYATSAQVTGSIYAADMADPTPINLTTAVENMITAYTDAAGRPFPDFSELGTGNIGGLTLIPGLYKWSSTVTIPTDVTISGGENDIWIFQIAENLLMSNDVNLTLIGGAKAENIFWQVAGDATFGTNSHFEGIILSMTGITFQTGASFNGRALAQTAVVLDGNLVTQP